MRKKPSESTKIEKETIVGVTSFIVIGIVVITILEIVTRVIYQKTLIDYFSPTENIGIFISLIIFGIIIIGMTAVVYAILHAIATARKWIPEFEGHYRIWNPFNKTRFVMNKKTNRPDLIYVLRRPQNWFKLPVPDWFRRRFEYMIIPIMVIGLFVILITNMYGSETVWVQTWIARPLTLLMFFVAIIVIFYLLTSSFWINRKPVITKEEFDVMIPHLEKADKILGYYAEGCFFKSHIWVVTQEDYDAIVRGLQVLVILE